MHYLIYKTTNLITGKVYIGQHITENINDGYLGSGANLKKDVKKLGRENFKKEIMYVFDNFHDMNNKEIEIVDKNFVDREDTYNIALGGKNFNVSGTVLVFKFNKWQRIPKSEFYNGNFKTVNSGKMIVYDENNQKIRINVEDYDRNVHRHPSKGKVLVYDENNNKKMVSIEEKKEMGFTPVFGGIVIENDGVRTYIDKKTFYDNKMTGVHKGKITCYDKETGDKRHIEKEEYYNNLDRYVATTKGFMNAWHKETNERKWISIKDKELYKNDYNFSTSGQCTVFSTEKSKFINIDKEKFNAEIHKRHQDIKFLWYDREHNIITTYWGSKKDFMKKYGLNNYFWECVKQEKTFITTDEKYEQYNYSNFKIIDWRKENGS